MRLAYHTDYSLRMLIYLQLCPDRWVSAREVAQAYDVSVHHMVKIGKELTQLGLLQAKSGRGGGLKLEGSAGTVRLGVLVRKLEKDQTVLPCVDGQGDCVILPKCQLRGVLAEAAEAFFAVLDKYQVEDLKHRSADLSPLLQLEKKPNQ